MDLKYQEPAVGITKTYDWGTSVIYDIRCECGSTDDTITLEVEADDSHVSVTHYVTVKTNWFVQDDWAYPLRALWKRIVFTYAMWVHGYVKYEASTLLSQQAAYNYGHTLLRAVEDVQRLRDERFKKNATVSDQKQ